MLKKKRQSSKVKPKFRNFRFQLKDGFAHTKVDPNFVVVGVCEKTLCVRSVSAQGALQKLRRWFNDVSQFTLVN